MANGRAIVAPPAFAPLQFGLLSAAQDRSDEAPAHWEAGITWQSECPDSGATYDPCLTVIRDDVDPNVPSEDPPPPAADKTATSDVFFLRGATPFSVYAKLDCSPVGFWERATDLATQALARSEGHQVETRFATGEALDENSNDVEVIWPHLQSDSFLIDDTGATLQTIADPIIGAGNPLDIVEAIGALESALGDCYHGQGVLHVPDILGASLYAENLVRRRGEQLASPSGHAIALGTGYPGDGPDGLPTEDVAWIYATGAVFYYRSAITVHRNVDSFDRSKNTLEALAERRYVMGWDCCHFAVPVTVGGVPAGEPEGAGPFTP